MNFQVTQGHITITDAAASATQTTVTSDGAGVAIIRFVPNDYIPIKLLVTVPGTSLSRTIYFSAVIPSE